MRQLFMFNNRANWLKIQLMVTVLLVTVLIMDIYLCSCKSTQVPKNCKTMDSLDAQIPQPPRLAVYQDELLEKVEKLQVDPPLNNSEFSKDLNISKKATPLFNDRLVLGPGPKRYEKWTGLLIMVITTASNIQQRQAIRETWGSVVKTHAWPWAKISMEVNIVFLVASEKNDSVSTKQTLSPEHIEHRDVLYFDLNETYRNLTRKVLLGLKWIHDHCHNVQFVLKSDDDSFVNIPLLTSFLKYHAEPNTIYGKAFFKSSVMRKGKWAVGKDTVPYDTYMSYVAGPGYVLNRDVLGPILNASQYAFILPFEDVFITGITPFISGVRVSHVAGFSWTMDRPPHPCAFSSHVRYIGTGFSPQRLRRTWTILTRQANVEC